MTQQQAKRDTSGQVGPKLQGLGKALPNKQFFRFSRMGKSKKRAMSIHRPCLPFLSCVPDKFCYRALQVIAKRSYDASKTDTMSLQLHDNSYLKKQFCLARALASAM